jgi:hypothetical protein
MESPHCLPSHADDDIVVDRQLILYYADAGTMFFARNKCYIPRRRKGHLYGYVYLTLYIPLIDRLFSTAQAQRPYIPYTVHSTHP